MTKVITIFSLVIICLNGFAKSDTQKMNETNKLKVLKITVVDTTTSNGSTDSYHDKQVTYTYTPSIDESNTLLTETKVNKKASLKEYLTAVKETDSDFLSQLEWKVPKATDSKNVVDDSEPTEGGVNFDSSVTISGSDWSIKGNSPKFFITSSPAAKLAREKGTNDTVMLSRQNPGFLGPMIDLEERKK